MGNNHKSTQTEIKWRKDKANIKQKVSIITLISGNIASRVKTIITKKRLIT